MAMGVGVKSAAPRRLLLQGVLRRSLWDGQDDWPPVTFPERLHHLDMADMVDMVDMAILLSVGTPHDPGKLILA